MEQLLLASAPCCLSHSYSFGQNPSVNRKHLLHIHPTHLKCRPDLDLPTSTETQQTLLQAHLLSDAKLYNLVERCEECWPRIKAAAAAAVSGEPSAFGGNNISDTLLPKILQCDEGMERALDRLKMELANRGYIRNSS